jgi:SAM-dependent methyltransferase
MSQLFRLPGRPRLPVPSEGAPPALLDLGTAAGLWLGGETLRPYRVVTVEPAVGDAARGSPGAAGDRRLHAAPERLPFADGAFAAVVVAGTVEFAGDDLDTLDEVARVLRTGGLLLLRTPRSGRLAWLDPYNVYHYVSDAVHRGKPLAKQGEHGWRRHYHRQELVELLGVRGFVVRDVGGAGFGLAEALTLAVLLVCRLALGSEGAERVARRLVRPLVRAEANLPTAALGYDVVIQAERV